MVEPRVTVIIPTRERSDVLRACLRTVIAQDYSNLDIIVSDNASVDDTSDVVRDLNDSRIRYLNPNKRLSMSHHWEFALSHVQASWVTIIGDDDGLLPSAIRRLAEIVADDKLRAVRSDACWYRWPSVTGLPHGRMGVPVGSKIVVRDATHWFRKVLNGHASYTDLPMLYTGTFVHTSVLDKIRADSGSIYRSSIPDVYSALAITSVISNYLFLEEPLALAGLSSRSNGVSFLYGTKATADKSLEFRRFLSEEIIPFHPDIPLDSDGSPPKSNQALVLESLLQSALLRNAETTLPHQNQLEIVLATAGVNRKGIEEWGERFAQLHGLDLKSARRRATHFPFRSALPTMEGRLRRGLKTSEVGSPTLPIRDVYEASVAAAAIRENVPGRIGNAASYLRRLIARIV